MGSSFQFGAPSGRGGGCQAAGGDSLNEQMQGGSPAPTSQGPWGSLDPLQPAQSLAEEAHRGAAVSQGGGWGRDGEGVWGPCVSEEVKAVDSDTSEIRQLTGVSGLDRGKKKMMQSGQAVGRDEAVAPGEPVRYSEVQLPTPALGRMVFCGQILLLHHLFLKKSQSLVSSYSHDYYFVSGVKSIV